MILIVDFGSQTAHLIGRRIRDVGVPITIVPPEEALTKIVALHPSGIIFSGGPASVYARQAPTIDKKVFSLGVPILGICYGQQLTAYLLGGRVKQGNKKEFGPATLTISGKTKLFSGVSVRSLVWMSHGDKVKTPPPGFRFVAKTESITAAAMVNEKKHIYCIQFHPEVEHTQCGMQILKNFLWLCKVKQSKRYIHADTYIKSVKNQIGSFRAIAAVSGGLDSTVAATIVARAIGKRLIPVHIESGLMRAGTTRRVISYFRQNLHVSPVIIDAKKKFLKTLAGVTDPEQKRKLIGKLYIDLFDGVVKKYTGVKFLVQGTIYSDVIESHGTKHSDTIKSHHNVGGLPLTMKLTLIEPIRTLYTDQVRALAKLMKIPTDFIAEQPHPGPGYAIRIVGEVTQTRLDMVTAADNIIIEEMKRSGWYRKLLHSFAILTGTRSTAVKGDGREFGEVVALRTIESRDRMTADYAKLPYTLLQTISSRIVNEVPNVSRVVYDITTKPPATMEWE
jgi:GMP synthase (glutamine-hydrolysing)